MASDGGIETGSEGRVNQGFFTHHPKSEESASDEELFDRLAALVTEGELSIEELFEMAKRRKPRAAEWEEYGPILTPAEVQALLQISRATFFRWIDAGKLPGAVKIGDSWRISRDTLRAHFQGGEK